MRKAAILEFGMGLTAVGRAYAHAAGGGAEADFASRALAALGVTPRIPAEDLRKIPAEGPLVVVANHPFGALDGLLLLEMTGRVRRDAKILGNSLLGLIPGLRDRLLCVDPFGSAAAVGRNASALRAAIRWLRRGGCIAMFPAGEVAHRMAADGRMIDSRWHATAAELAFRTEAAVVPVHFEGSNSRLFRLAGRVHPLLRTALLPRELWAKRGAAVAIRVGEPTDAAALAAVGADRRTNLLRARVDALARSEDRIARAPDRPACRVPPRFGRPIAARGSATAIEADVTALGSSRLLECGAFEVFCAGAAELPAVLPEIGRLRELAFRGAGEGSGLARDLDRFDDTYQHLFVWDRERKNIAGAYRLAGTDEIAARSGVEGLYTRTLFEYDAALLAELGPALELGRAFVPPTYQRDFSPLMLLWKGICRVVARAPRYRRLIGVVSISDLYESTSRWILVRFLEATRYDQALGPLVRAMHPPRLVPRDAALANTTVREIDEVSRLVRRLEPDGKDIPVLLRQYLKLNAKLLGFSVDPSFGNALDGLVMIDLHDVEPAILSRFMGRTEARQFLGASRSDA